MTEKQKQFKHAMFEYGKKLMMDEKPHLLPYLLELGVLEEHAKTFTVKKAHNVIRSLLRKKLNEGKPKDSSNLKVRVDKYFWLWTHGIPISGLRRMTSKEAIKLLKMIWESNAERKY